MKLTYIIFAALASADNLFEVVDTEPNGCMNDLDLIKQGEGLRKCMYHDTMGIPTVCYGYNLQNPGAMSEVASAGGNYDDLMAGGCTSQSVCNNLLNKYVKSSEASAKQIYGTLSCKYAQYVADDMTYNLGAGGMSSFHTFISLMKSG